MASLAVTNAYVSLGGTDISAYIEAVDLDFTMETDDDTHMGDTAVQHIATRQNWSCSLTAKSDYADGLMDEILYDILVAKAAVALIVAPNGSSITSSNPSYTGQVVLTGYKPLQGSHGQKARTPVQLMPAGALVRAEA